jgi:hypothetical protein
MSPTESFHSYHYLRHNARRLEHLARLRIPVAGLSVLEVGAGIGDHSHYYIDRGCSITITEARSENLEILRNRYPDQNVRFLDMEAPAWIEEGPYDVTHCYGLLYHLSNPEQALAFLSQCTKKMLFLETCVSFGEGNEINPIKESQGDPSQAYSGTGCRLTRKWVFEELRRLFQFVYIPKTQPRHEEFPTDWNTPEAHKTALQRAIFIASREPIGNELLADELNKTYFRHE